MKYFIAGILFLVVILAVVGGAFFAGRKQATPSPSPSISDSEEAGLGQPEPVAAPPKKTFSGGGILSFAAYSGEAAPDWSVSRETQGPDIERLYLARDGYQISIMQGATGGVICLYPGDPEFEGPSARYDTFVDILGKQGESFRRGGADSSQVDWIGFTVCEMRQDQYIAPTSFGHLSYRLPKNYDQQVLEDMDAIVASLKAL